MSGRLISFEGIDGVGKTTHVSLLVEHLLARGCAVTTYREPGATQLGEQLRALLKAGYTRSPLSELLLFAAARAELVQTRVLPDISSGHLVVLDRFTESTLAYQGALGQIPEEILAQVCRAAAAGLKPHLTLWLDLPPGGAYRRRYPLAQALGGSAARAAGSDEPDFDAFEIRDADYFARVRARYHSFWQAEPARIIRIDAAGGIEETCELVRAVVDAKLKEWGHG